MQSQREGAILGVFFPICNLPDTPMKHCISAFNSTTLHTHILHTTVSVGGCHGDQVAAADRNSLPCGSATLKSLKV